VSYNQLASMLKYSDNDVLRSQVKNDKVFPKMEGGGGKTQTGENHTSPVYVYTVC